MPTFEAPRSVIDAALKASQVIGNGLYGVDVKEKDGKGYVIEVNDNPNIDRGIEDKYLGDELYLQITSELLRRMENSSKGVLKASHSGTLPSMPFSLLSPLPNPMQSKA